MNPLSGAEAPPPAATHPIAAVPGATTDEPKPLAPGPRLDRYEAEPVRAELDLGIGQPAPTPPGRSRPLRRIEDYPPAELAIPPEDAVRPSGIKPPRRANPVRDANQRHRARKRRETLALLDGE